MEDESIRFQRLKQISGRSLEESVKYLTTDRLASCYPTIASTGKGTEALKQARAQIANYWHTTATREFEAVFEERDIHQKMLELDEILDLAKKRMDNEDSGALSKADQPVFMDKLTPSQVVDAHLRPVQEQQITSLEKELEEIKLENKELLEQLDKDDAKIDEIAAEMRTWLGEIDAAASDAARDLPSRQTIGKFVDNTVS